MVGAMSDRAVFLLVFGMLLAVGLAVACGYTDEPASEPTAVPVVQEAPTCRPTPVLEVELKETISAILTPGTPLLHPEWPFNFSEDLFTLTGPSFAVSQVVSKLRPSEENRIVCEGDAEGRPGMMVEIAMPSLELVGDLIELRYVDDLVADSASGTVTECTGLKDWAGKRNMVLGLFRIDPDSPHGLGDENVAAAEVLLIKQLAERCPLFRAVRADLVWGTGGLGGNPWTAMGSPWTAMGSPWVDALVPYAGTMEAENAFWCQWALGEQEGIGLIELKDPCEPPFVRTVEEYRGHGVRVGIFDTVPVALSSASLEYTHVAPPLSLEVSTTLADLDVWSVGKAPALPPIYPLDQHGVFVAGLVHAVAPQSTIYLYQVLNEDGWGDLFTLNKALHSFISEAKADLDSGEIDGAVINLSLGSPLNILDYLSPEAILKLVSGEEPQLTEQDREALAHWASLHTLLSAAQCQGIVVVAASGNDEAAEAWQFVELPATLTESIGVAASGQDRQQTCFSRDGDVQAPGGEGACPLCQWVLDDTEACHDDCQYGLISLVTISDEFRSGYAFGAGTSFSAPLVSGLAALVLDMCDGNISADEVAALIEAGSRDGIINVPDTLKPELCSTLMPAP